MLTARFVTTHFTRHTHPMYTFGVITGGVQEYSHPGGTSRVGAGGLAVVGPDEAHTGHAGVPEGWTYRVFYPRPEVVVGIARELGLRGTPAFSASGIDAPEAVRLLHAAHLAAERGDRLGASSLMRDGIASLLRSHGRERLPRTRGATARPEASRARDVLVSRMTDPPTLEELAAEVGMGPFALSRAFSSAYGLPPRSYLNQLRVDRARALLVAGRTPSQVAAEVGFTDQAHLSRHFRSRLGVPPGAYRRALADR